MLISIDPETLTEDERHYLSNGLEKLENPSPSCKNLLTELQRLSTAAFDKFCRDNPGSCI